MYFAVNSTDAVQIAATLEQAFGSEASKTPNLQLLALLDTAFDHDQKPLSWPTRGVPLYVSFDLEPLLPVSPMLLQLSAPSSPEFAEQLHLLLRHCSARPMLSFVFSASGAVALRDAWADLHRVETEDGQSFLLRIADTRVSCALPQVLAPAHWARLHAPLREWWVIDRHGKAAGLPAPGRLPPPESNPAATVLGADVLSALLRSSEPDTLIDAIDRRMPDLLPVDAGGALHQQVVDVCRLADHFGLEAHADRYALTVAALADPGLLSHPGLNAVLSSPERSGRTLLDRLQVLYAERG